jgi:hypothetical protein
MVLPALNDWRQHHIHPAKGSCRQRKSLKKSKQKYLVVPKSKTVRESNIFPEIIILLEKMSDVSVERIVGPQDSPKRIVIRSDQASIQKLQSQFGDQLIIEPDSELEMY